MKTKLLGTVAVAGFISYTGKQVWADGSFVLHKQKKYCQECQRGVWSIIIAYYNEKEMRMKLTVQK